MTRSLLRRRRRSIYERILAPGYGCCFHCHRPWKFADHHATEYGDGRGCFALCEDCWSELTIEERLPYYQQLLFAYWAGTPKQLREDWAKIRRAVEAGK